MAVALVVGDDVALFGSAIRAEQVLLAWTLFWLWRAAAVSLAPRRPHFWARSLAAAALLASPLWFGSFVLPDTQWWEEPEQALARDERYPSPAAEEVLIKQPELLYDALNDLEDERPGITDLYFVGFAPYAAEDVFRKDMEVARKLFEERFDTDGRSVVLVNNPRTVLEQPLATVSNLRATLSVVGDMIDPEQDVVMVYLTSHGSRDHRLSVQFPPLELDSLTPDALTQMLDDAGTSGASSSSRPATPATIDPLRDEHTLIMTASAVIALRSVAERERATYFGDALFQHALRFEDSFGRLPAGARAIAARAHRTPEGVGPAALRRYGDGEAAAARSRAAGAALGSD
jgi:hypothetical protein